MAIGNPRPKDDVPDPAGGRPGFDWKARAQVDAWVEESRAMFERAGLARANQGMPPEIVLDPRYQGAHSDPMNGELRFGYHPVSKVPFSASKDVVAHEYAHWAVAQAFRLPVWSVESMSVQEGLADVFASAVDTDDWTMGEDLYPGTGQADRSMSDPSSIKPPAHYGIDEYPDHNSEFASVENPHANMGIGNKAAYLIGDKLGRERMAELYVSALKDFNADDVTYQALADATLAAAGADAKASAAVLDAWKAVGIDATTPQPRVNGRGSRY
jgi:hypothetical protein